MAVAAAVWAGVSGATAQETNAPAPDKSGYNLFNPVPDDLMRDLSPDRPDETESPYTVDAGHYQWEMDFANFTYDKSGGTTTKAWDVGDFNLKAGLLNNVDLQFMYDNYLNVWTRGPSGHAATESGFGDLTTRLKVNLWGDDGGQTAFALLPYVKIPTATGGLGNGAVEGGMILPFAVSLPHDFDLSMETVEFFSNFTTESHSGWVGTVDTGLEYMATKNIQLDANCFFGVTPAAPDINPFAGITVRF
jgi:hypothetical protein